jgi:hypothetical protein
MDEIQNARCANPGLYQHGLNALMIEESDTEITLYKFRQQ